MYQSQLLAAITEHVFLCAHLKQSAVGKAGGATNVWMVVQGNCPCHDLCRNIWGAAPAFQGDSLRRCSVLVALVTKTGYDW